MGQLPNVIEIGKINIWMKKYRSLISGNNLNNLFVIQMISIIGSIIGLVYLPFNLSNFLLIILGYFLYSGIGISLSYHRYYSHKSFQFKHKLLENICLFFGILACRGSPLAWAYIHRLHHKNSDTFKDPHKINIPWWRTFFSRINIVQVENDKLIIRDFLNKKQILINRYYMIFIILYATILGLYDLEFLCFLYAIPLVLTNFSLLCFVYLPHKFGYRNHTTQDNSRNNWLVSFILWGEGWHNNHHNDPKKYNLKEKWWEFDLLSIIIKGIKK